jgi:hypothetical protein
MWVQGTLCPAGVKGQSPFIDAFKRWLATVC